MIPWEALLLPALLSAVAVFFLSSLLHMVLNWHRPDYRAFSNEDEVRLAIGRTQPPPGQYVLPFWHDGKQMERAELQTKFQQGPVGFVFVRPNGLPRMGPILGTWLVHCLLISLVAGYLARAVLSPGAEFLPVLQVIGVATWLGYVGAEPSASIWKGQPWTSTMRFLVDGLVYAAASGAIFAALWPR